MERFASLLKSHLEKKALSAYRLALSGGLDPALLNKVLNGKRSASQELLEKLAAVPELGLSLTVLKAWRAMDDYTPEELAVAFREVQRLMEGDAE